MNLSIQTVKAGKSYRVIREGSWFLLSLTDNDTVLVQTKTATVGQYYLSRFSGHLSPATIRQFWGE